MIIDHGAYTHAKQQLFASIVMTSYQIACVVEIILIDTQQNIRAPFCGLIIQPENTVQGQHIKIIPACVSPIAEFNRQAFVEVLTDLQAYLIAVDTINNSSLVI